MAEWRRRKRPNDRLSMLRSVVPSCDKMDRTSILGDTIDYRKELLEKIKHLQELVEASNKANLIMSPLKAINSNEMVSSNPPNFEVERRDADSRIEVSCVMKSNVL
ncbi:hypothetical protein GW17_00049900 [Ensete ventricosum]|nr:hypothetical protein GW17_00049900 [Ensete ventricosum]